jgi:hypothetical protein
MRKPSGFVPISFNVTGKVLVGIGVAILFIDILFMIFRRISLAPAILLFSAAIIIVGLYLIFIAPKDE